MKQITKNFSSKVNAIKTNDKKEFYNRLTDEYKMLYKAKGRNQLAFDARILFPDKAFYGGRNFTEAAKQKHIAHLKATLGEKGYERLYENAKEKIDEFKESHKAMRIELKERYAESLAKGDSSGYDLELKRWTYNNSPWLASQFLAEGYSRSAEKGIFIRPEKERFLQTVPRKVNSKGETGFYDNNYARIEENEKLFEFYEYTLQTLKTIKRYLPHFQTSGMQINSLPTIKQTVMEEYMQDGVGAGLGPLMDSLARATRTDDLSVTASEIDPITGEPRKELQTQFLQDTSSEITAYIDRMKIKYKQEH